MDQKISVAELALINPAFPNLTLSKFEQILSKPIKAFKVKISERSEEQRRKKAAMSIQRMRIFRRFFVLKPNLEANVNEAHWHGKQAAYAIEKSINQ